MSVLGEHLREARLRHGVSQRSLARRAATTQTAISRLESGRESPSFERFTQLLLVLGERPVLAVAPLELDVDPGDLARGRRLTPEQRLAESASWNRMATRLEIAGAAASDPRTLTAALDVRTLVATLHRYAVDYTVVGGIAVQVHGHRRTTKNLDLIPEPDRGNCERLTAAVAELGSEHGELHILRNVPGAPPYADLRARALVIDFDGIALAIAGLDDLIAMKRASGRPSDERDIAALTALLEP